jgi:uncharacterized membrane protein
MHIVAGTFTSRAEARSVLNDLAKIGIAPANMNVIEGDDFKGFKREHRPTGAAAQRGAVAGSIFGAVLFGVLFKLSYIDMFTLRFLALYAGSIVIAAGFGATILACWNMGISHDEARLFEEARERGQVIAAVEVSDPMEERVIHELETRGASDVRSGLWQPQGWKHAYPTYDLPA